MQTENIIDKTTARQLSGRAYGNWYWIKRDKATTKAERVKEILEYRKYRALQRTAPVETNGRGNEIYRDEDADKMIGKRRGEDRYYYDFEALGKDWKQYDTKQDASYFGVWVNVAERKTFTYAEGDRTLVVCPTPESFAAELADAERFYGDPPPMAISFDMDGTRAEYYDVRPAVEAVQS